MSTPIPLDATTLLAQRQRCQKLALDILGDHHRAEDAVQEAWVRALEQPPSSIRTAGAWFRSVVRNLALSTARRERERLGREASTVEPGADAAERDFQFAGHVTQALAALPEPYRTSVHLRYWRDLGPNAIAERTRVPVATVKTRLRRGLELLRTDLDRRIGERRAWCSALAAFARVPMAAPPVSPAAPVATWLTPGALTMKTLTTTVLALSAVATAVWFALPAADTGTSTPEPAVAAASDEGASELGVASTARRAAAARTERTEGASSIAAAPVDVAPRARLRVVSLEGAALGGVTASFVEEPDTAVETGVDGEAGLAYSIAPDDSFERTLRLSHPGHLDLERTVTLRAAETDLGTLVLVRGGRLRGTVVADDGAPIPNALVVVTSPDARIYGSPSSAIGPAAYEATHTDATGAFQRTGLTAGAVRVWATAEGYEDGASDVVQVAAGGDHEVRIVLPTGGGADEITGRVRLPDGVTATGLTVWHRHTTHEGSRVQRVPTDELGRFRIRVQSSLPHDLWAHGGPTEWDDERHVFVGERALAGWNGVVAEAVPPGTSNLVLTLERAPTSRIDVQDERGRPIPEVTLGVIEGEGNDLRMEIPWFRDVETPIRLGLPSLEFYLTVAAHGYERAVYGPYTQASAPAELLVQLEPRPLLRGRALAAGEPVAGARISLHRTVADGRRIVSGGLELRMSAAPSGEATTDAAGRYELTLRSGGAYFLCARADGWAAAELGPLELDPSIDEVGLDFELVRGGAIEGHVLAPLGVDVAGWTIVASCGDPYPERRTTGPDGRYRFEGLRPGPWLVARGGRDPSTYTESTRNPIAWSGNCEVADERTTRFDLDLRADAPAVLAGRWAFGDEAPTEWVAQLQHADGVRLGKRADRAPIAADGTFELVAEKPGRYQLFLQGGELDDGGLAAIYTLELEGGENVWSERLKTGRLTGALDPSRLSGLPIAFLVGDQDAAQGTMIRPNPDGTFDALVPAGDGALRQATPELADENPLLWPEIGRAVVPAKGSASLR